jgi:hypothetical protein
MLPRTAKIAPACGIMISCFEVRIIRLSCVGTNNNILQGVGKFLEKKDP